MNLQGAVLSACNLRCRKTFDEHNKVKKVLLGATWIQRIYAKHSAASDVFIPVLLSLMNEKKAAKEQKYSIFTGHNFTGHFFGKFL